MSEKDHKQSSSQASSFQQDFEDLEEALKELRTLSQALLDVAEEEEEEGHGDHEVDGDDHQRIENESGKPVATRASSKEQVEGKGTAKKGEAGGKQKPVHANGQKEKQKQNEKKAEISKKGAEVARSPSSSLDENTVASATEFGSSNSSSAIADQDLRLSFGMPAQSVLFIVMYCITLLCLQNADITIVSASSAHVEHEKRVRLTVCPSSLLSMPATATKIGLLDESVAVSARRSPSVLVLDAAASRENLINAVTLAPEYFGSLFVHYLSLLKTGRSFFSGHVREDGRGHGRSVTMLIVSCPFLEPLTVSIAVAIIVCMTRFVAVFMDAAYADARRVALHKKWKSSDAGTKSQQQKVILLTEKVQPRLLSVNFVIVNIARLLAGVPIMALQHALLVVFVVGIANNIAIMLDLTDRMLIMC